MLMPRSFRFHNIATRRTFGTACLISSRRLVARAAALSEMPVMLPPGRARLSIRRVATGSPTPKKTTVGTFATLQARVVGKPAATITSTPLAFMPLTISPSLLTWPPAPRASNARFLPSV